MKNRPDYFTHAVEAHDVAGLEYPGFVGETAHPKRDQAISVRRAPSSPPSSPVNDRACNYGSIPPHRRSFAVIHHQARPRPESPQRFEKI